MVTVGAAFERLSLKHEEEAEEEAGDGITLVMFRLQFGVST